VIYFDTANSFFFSVLFIVPVFDLPESQVVVLNSLERLSKGDTIYAVYPDTTSFYQATVVQAPRKQGSNAMNQASMSNPNSSTITSTTQQFVMVHFVDDADEFGITHDKAVPIQHIMLPPSSI
jgi:SGF29 tudor-like domain